MRFLTLTSDSLLLYATTLAQKFDTVPWYGKAGGLVVGIITFVARDLLFGALLLATLASVVDWYYGRAVALKEGRFQKEIGTYGWQVKAGAVLVVLLIRAAEAWLYVLPESFSVNTHGAVSAALAFGIFVDELDSIDENLRALGGSGIPGLTRALAWLRAVSGRWVSVSGTPLPPPEAKEE